MNRFTKMSMLASVAALVATTDASADNIVKKVVYASCGKDGGIASRLETIRSDFCIKDWKRNNVKGYKVSGACFGPFNQDYVGQSRDAGCVTFVKDVKDSKTKTFTVKEAFTVKFKFLGFDAEVSFLVNGHCELTKAETCTPEVKNDAKYGGQSVKIESYSTGYALVDARMDSAGELSASYKGEVLDIDADLKASFKCDTILEAHRFVNMEPFEYTCKKNKQ